MGPNFTKYVSHKVLSTCLRHSRFVTNQGNMIGASNWQIGLFQSCLGELGLFLTRKREKSTTAFRTTNSVLLTKNRFEWAFLSVKLVTHCVENTGKFDKHCCFVYINRSHISTPTQAPLFAHLSFDTDTLLLGNM